MQKRNRKQWMAGAPTASETFFDRLRKTEKTPLTHPQISAKINHVENFIVSNAGVVQW